MRNLNELSINNSTYYFYNDIINLKDFHSNLIKIDKKQYKKLIFTISVILQLKKLVIVKILKVLIHYI